MSNKEKEMLKISYQQKFAQLLDIRKFVDEGRKGWSKEDYAQQCGIVLGYKMAVLELLELNKRTGTCQHIIEQWEKEVIEKNKQEAAN
jgi:hypothetical protein